MSTKLCVDCKYCVESVNNLLTKYVCHYKAKKVQDVVTGNYYYINEVNCYDMRSPQNSTNFCGPDGAFFEPKPTTIFGLESK